VVVVAAAGIARRDRRRRSDLRLHALVSKVVPCAATRSRPRASAGAIRDDDSLKSHFDVTVAARLAGDQTATEYFVAHCTEEMTHSEQPLCGE
jgi:hypothetical protein